MDRNGRLMLLENLVTYALPITAPVIYFFIGGRLCRLQHKTRELVVLHNPLAGTPLALLLLFCFRVLLPLLLLWPPCGRAPSFSGLSLVRLLSIIKFYILVQKNDMYEFEW